VPHVKVDFWDVLDDQNETLDLLPIIQRAATFPLKNRIKERMNKYVDILEEAITDGEEGWGLIVRARKENVPGLVNTKTGITGILPLGPDETVGEQMNFLYNRPLQVLVTQRNPIVRSTALDYLLFDITKADFHLQPKLRQDAWQRLERMERIGRLDLKIHGPRHHPDFSAEIPSLNKMLEEASEKGSADTVELILSCDRRKESRLDIGVVRGVLAKLRGGNEAQIKKLSVSGKDRDNSRSEVVDFIRDRLVHSGEVEYEGHQLNKEQCRQLLRQAIESNRAYLRSLL